MGSHLISHDAAPGTGAWRADWAEGAAPVATTRATATCHLTEPAGQATSPPNDPLIRREATSCPSVGRTLADKHHSHSRMRVVGAQTGGQVIGVGVGDRGRDCHLSDLERLCERGPCSPDPTAVDGGPALTGLEASGAPPALHSPSSST